jgi:hypothetical protein
MVRAKVLDMRGWLAACAIGAAGWITLSCASAEDETGFRGPRDASADRGPGFGGTAGQAFGGTAGTGFGGMGVGGAGGVGGMSFGGNAGNGVGGVGGGTCNPSFCPNDGTGQPCCMGPDGPCGVEVTGSCQAPTTTDF